MCVSEDRRCIPQAEKCFSIKSFEVVYLRLPEEGFFNKHTGRYDGVWFVEHSPTKRMYRGFFPFATSFTSFESMSASLLSGALLDFLGFGGLLPVSSSPAAASSFSNRFRFFDCVRVVSVFCSTFVLTFLSFPFFTAEGGLGLSTNNASSSFGVGICSESRSKFSTTGTSRSSSSTAAALPLPFFWRKVRLFLCFLVSFCVVDIVDGCRKYIRNSKV